FSRGPSPLQPRSSVSLSWMGLVAVWYMSICAGNAGDLRGLWSRLGAPLVPALRPIGGADPRQPIARHHVHDPKPDVHAVVRDALEVAVDQKVPGAGFDVQLALRHPADDVLEVLVV